MRFKFQQKKINPLFFELSLRLYENVLKEYVIKFLDKKNPSTVAKDYFATKFFFENVLHQKIKLPPIKRNKTLPEILTINEIKKNSKTSWALFN